MPLSYGQVISSPTMRGRSKVVVGYGGYGAGLNPPEWEQPRKIPAEKQGKVGSISGNARASLSVVDA